MIKTCRLVKVKSGQLKPAGNSSGWRRTVWLVLPRPTSRHFGQLPERGGHRFEPKCMSQMLAFH